MTSKLRSRLEFTCLGVAVATAPILGRLYLRLHEGAPLSGSDFLGALSDLGVSLIFATALIGLIRRLRVAAMLLVFIWCLFNYGSYEHIRELGVGLQFAFAGFATDITFLTGSMLVVTSPALLWSSLILSLFACGWLVVQKIRLPGARFFLIGGSSLLVLLSVLSGSDPNVSWRERHFAHQNLESLLGQSPASTTLEPVSEATALVFSADLTGEPRIKLPRPRTNVLLLVLEGLPAIIFDDIAQQRGLTQMNGTMPHLNTRAAQGIRASNFVLHNRQTNRGLYSLLCGRLPKLTISTSRMTEYAHAGGLPCLPHLLGEASYRTAFIQAAPLTFMLKGAFSEKAGFDEIYGDQHFKNPIVRARWGVDDRSLFRNTKNLIHKLEKSEDPWFITLLTAGTHHPFQTMPENAFPRMAEPTFEFAVRYLDASLFEFLLGIENAGVLENTLVIITADESRGAGLATDIPSLLIQNWGPLLMLLPTRESMTLIEPYGQSDIAISILDYLGIDASESRFTGRSLFRKYADTRKVYFGNVFHDRTGAIDSAGSVLWCDKNGSSCSKFKADPAMLFNPIGESLPADADELTDLQYVIQRALGNNESVRREQVHSLSGAKEIPLLLTVSQAILGGQNIYVPERSRVEITVEWTVEGGEGETIFTYTLVKKEYVPFYHAALPPASAGDRLTIHLEFETLDSIRILKNKLFALGTTSDELRIRFDSAILKITPIPDGETLEVDNFVSRPDFFIRSSGETLEPETVHAESNPPLRG